MGPFVREAQELILDGGTVARPEDAQPPCDEWGTVDVSLQDLVGALRRPGEPAGVVRPMDTLFAPVQ